MTIHVVKGADGFDRRAFSADDVRRMTEAGILGENDPFELVDGELIQMAAKGYAHDRAKDALARRVIMAVDAGIGVSVEGTLQLDGLTLVEPDILVFRQAAASPSPEGYKVVRCADILLLIEVADSSLLYDKRHKASLYAGQGIRDYWIVDLTVPQVIVHREPSSEGYRDVRTLAPTDSVVPLASELRGFAPRLGELL